jgi:uncharacterized protein (DUF302 family)
MQAFGMPTETAGGLQWQCAGVSPVRMALSAAALPATRSPTRTVSKRHGTCFRDFLGANVKFTALMLTAATVVFGAACGQRAITGLCERTDAEDALNGITNVASAFGTHETMDRLEAAVQNKGMTVFARIDHAAGAVAVGLSLRPTELLVFGNARGGTPLMQAFQTIGLDLPLKALVWQDAYGKTWLSYNDPRWIVARHGADASIETATEEMATALAALSRAAAEAH